MSFPRAEPSVSALRADFPSGKYSIKTCDNTALTRHVWFHRLAGSRLKSPRLDVLRGSPLLELS